jgi:hypothetical protein
MADEDREEAATIWHLWEDDAITKFVEEWDADEPTVWRHSVRVHIHPADKPENITTYCVGAEAIMQYTATKV